MSKTWLLALFAVILSVIVAYWTYGLGAFVFPTLFLTAFFVFFGLYYLGGATDAEATPGLENLDEPDFFSRIYMTWLYVNDRESWAYHVALFSYLLGAFIGSIFGILILFNLSVDFNASLAGWLLAMFITLLAAIKMATSKRWTRMEETVSYGEYY